MTSCILFFKRLKIPNLFIKMALPILFKFGIVLMIYFCYYYYEDNESVHYTLLGTLEEKLHPITPASFYLEAIFFGDGSL